MREAWINVTRLVPLLCALALAGAGPAAADDAPRTRPSGADTQAGAGYVTHVVYFVPRDKADQALDTDGTISDSISSMRSWFFAQMGRAPRMDMASDGDYGITFVSGDHPAASYAKLSDITTELQRKGFNAASKRYLIYAAVNEGSTCGASEYPIEPGTTGHYAAVYLDSSAGCGARSFGDGSATGAGKSETIAAHEWLHEEAVAPLASPHACASSPYHVCTGALWQVPGLDPEEPDIEFPVINKPLSQKVLDIGHDDYLDAPWPWIPNLRSSPWLE